MRSMVLLVHQTFIHDSPSTCVGVFLNWHHSCLTSLDIEAQKPSHLYLCEKLIDYQLTLLVPEYQHHFMTVLSYRHHLKLKIQ